MVDTLFIVGAAIAGFVLLAIGGGVGYFVWIGSRPKKMTWKAYVYQLGDGVLPIETKNGKPIRDYKLSDLKPYTTDIVEKIDKKSGATHYWLKGLKKALPVVTADCVEVWGNKDKWVRVLLDGDTTTLLKAGYDRRVANQIFKPMPHDRINMIKTEIEERNIRIENTKDVLAQITPFVVTAVSIVGLVICVYFMANGAVRIAELNNDGMKGLSEQVAAFRTDLFKTQGCFIQDEDKLIQPEEIPTAAP